MQSADSFVFLGFITSFLLLLTLIPLLYSMQPIKLFYACMSGLVGLENISLILLLQNFQDIPEDDRVFLQVGSIALALCVFLSLCLIISFERHTVVMWRKIWHDRDIWLYAGQVCLEKLCDALWHTCGKTVTFIWRLMLAGWICIKLILWLTWMVTKLLWHVTMLAWIYACYFTFKDWREQVKSPKRAPMEPPEEGKHTPAMIRHLRVVAPTSWANARGRLDKSFRHRPASKI